MSAGCSFSRSLRAHTESLQSDLDSTEPHTKSALFGSDVYVRPSPEYVRAMCGTFEELPISQGYNLGSFDRQFREKYRLALGISADEPFVALTASCGSMANMFIVSAHRPVGSTVVLHANSHGVDRDRGAHGHHHVISADRDLMNPKELEECLRTYNRSRYADGPRVHAVEVTNPVEKYSSCSDGRGQLYPQRHLREIADIAHRYGAILTVDGARLWNAVDGLGCSLRDITVDAGVDAFTLGGTKCGMVYGEAVFFLPGYFRHCEGGRGLLSGFEGAPRSYMNEQILEDFKRKLRSMGGVIPRSDSISAQFLAAVMDDTALTNARISNDFARRALEILKQLPGFIEAPSAVHSNAVWFSAPALFMRELLQAFPNVRVDALASNDRPFAERMMTGRIILSHVDGEAALEQLKSVVADIAPSSRHGLVNQ